MFGENNKFRCVMTRIGAEKINIPEQLNSFKFTVH